ncbi:MAG: CAP Gly-rich domain-containing protein [Olpidium bornovanus]|uniref:CAP Gly-rich domain-containing protein n=1 Tax=Olpidium bornovanus TaxID=278681 RepID=A0A8H8DL68_9FUNG|nr:MAG: CAP Gly-rich domain-containing protein [Olpidium bornovanus]
MSVVTVFVTSDGSSSERRFDKALTLSALKARLEPITGVPAAAQQLSLYNGDKLVGALEAESEDSTRLGAFPVENFARIHVGGGKEAGHHTGCGMRNEFSDLSGVEKYELADDEYDKRTDSVRAFKIRNKIGRFAESNSTADSPQKTAYAEPPVGVSIGSRFEAEVDRLKRRGVVRYIGITRFKPGFWVGVEYDEPLGKHDGTWVPCLVFLLFFDSSISASTPK